MKNNSKYKLRDILFHKQQNIFMMVDAVDVIKHKGTLYTLKVLKETHPSQELAAVDNWKRYYEPKIEDECILVFDQDNVRTLYGKSV